MRTEPTPKQKLWAIEYMKDFNATRAARKVYRTAKPITHATLGTNNLRSPIVRPYLKKLMEQAGFTDEFSANKLKVIADSGTSKKALKAAQVKDALRAIELSEKLKGNLVERKKVEKATLNISYTDKSPEELLVVLEDTKKELDSFLEMVNRGRAKSNSILTEEVPIQNVTPQDVEVAL